MSTQPANPPIRPQLWLQRGAWSLADQWLFSGANFVAQILLARWLLPAEYGAFALSFAIFLLLGAVHTAVLIDPMLIFGAGRYHANQGPYWRFLLGCHAGFSLLAMLLLGLASALARGSGAVQLADALLGACLAAPWILLAWLVRRAFYLESQAHKAGLSSLLFAACLLAGFWLTRQVGLLNPLTAFLLMGLAGLLVSLIFIGQLKSKSALAASSRPSFGEMLASQWGYARWSAGTALLIWVPLNLFFLLPYADGLAGPADLRAASNLLTPLMQSTLALTTLALPQLAKAYSEEGIAPVMRGTKIFVAYFLAGAALYWLLLGWFHQPIFDLLYAGQYQDASQLLILAGAVPLLFGLGAILENALRAMEQPRSVFYGYLAASLVAGTLGLWLTQQFQVGGALLGQAIAFGALVLVLSLSLRRLGQAA